jgi:exodeoxyribonuclease-3
VKIASWNVNSLRVRLGQVLSWLESSKPDVLGLQETKLADEKFPQKEFSELGYECAFSGQPAYNGVALLSRSPILDVRTELEAFDDPQRRVLAANTGSVRVMNLYVPNGESVDSEKYLYKLNWLAALGVELRRELGRHDRVVVMGDFNIAPEDRDVHDPVAWEGHVLCSPKERAALTELLALGLDDTFRLFAQPQNRYSWWDYRAGAFRRNRGLRIDLILASKALSERCTASAIDPAPRRLERPSDHAPVLAEFDVR